ncbi:HEXXH motif-containing putative peptide modification protein [Streptomyces sp. DT2A-34]|uniref:aKG-HExxH-type peptide beta-hydroxylase n=1 Tax=Streptomyces sp. DT2A-34 TaxID=3051182 RepID=UPI00265B8E9D|nr:HEXXH motif-containing putative peptide modification protein [Streptomyces sp. DT2A-34]MDO0917762.1 HEXXH motif-containing putative peptide modification protein [Streptomyces sp. DT2A-34]
MASAASFTEREFGGFPFLDLSFLPGRLLTAVACVRASRRTGSAAPPGPDELNDVLTPLTALAIRRMDMKLDIPGGPLAPERQAAVNEALATIAAAVPAWEPLVRLPIRFLRLRDGGRAIGASCYAWPQHVLLGDDAFASRAELAEQVLHEVSHNWLYLVEEIKALQHRGCDHTLTLPSGTSEREPDEILGAAHVVLNVRRLWQRMDVDEDQRSRRLTDLASYLEGCLSLIDEARVCLTDDGQALADRLLQEAVAA